MNSQSLLQPLDAREILPQHDYFERVDGHAQIFTGPVTIQHCYVGQNAQNNVITSAERGVLDYIAKWTELFDTLPSLDDLYTGLKSTTTELRTVLKHLEATGYLICYTIVQKWFKLTAHAQHVLNVDLPDFRPVAGFSIASKPGQQSFGECPVKFVKVLDAPRESVQVFFNLGDSMVKAGILDHDYLYVEPLTPGDPLPINKVVIARCGDKCYVKRLIKVQKRHVLHSENADPAYQDIELDTGDESEHFEIIGKVIGAFREIV